MLLKKALLHIYGVRSIYNIVNVCMPYFAIKDHKKATKYHENHQRQLKAIQDRPEEVKQGKVMHAKLYKATHGTTFICKFFLFLL